MIKHGREQWHYDDRECLERFRQKDSVYQEKILHWAETRLEKMKTKNDNVSSYGLKHICEKAIEQYVSNDDMKAAMELCGFTSFNKHELNQYYNITKRSIKEARKEAREIQLKKNK